MKPENIKEKQAKRKKSAVRSVVLFALFQLAVAACFCALALAPGGPGWLKALFMALAKLSLALIVPAILVLKARFKEIEGGELDAAAKY